ncbi:hypothetical protein [Halochromatium salexigens]|uniref:Uncharacterized protein n=1 Tax=Halochromatium salexigens TaxID=49447 RepID=A0AAJ0UD21_HALSE|nr:hypothetical protein [Halochromatium salexigens]MBK5929245.1 hypothetical protein [Halochromatium salexigens]
MELPFTHKPGRRERHLRRRHENPLFAWPPHEVPPEDLLAAQKADHDDMLAFDETLQALIQRAVDLPPDAGSDAVLSLKEALESHYEQSYALPEDHSEARTALKRLIGLIMKTLWRHAGSDPVAHQELSDEETARAIHLRLIEQPLVADLLHPESCIGPEELVPSLLSAPEAEIEAACELFDARELAELLEHSERRLEALDAQGIGDLDQARNRLTLIRLHAQQSNPAQPPH